MALTDDLISYWELEEASGTRFDAHGSNDLTDENTVTSNTGKVGDAAHFSLASSESLSLADNASISVGDEDFTFCAWVYLDSKPGTNMVIAGQYDTAGRSWLLYWLSAAEEIHFIVSSAGTSTDGDVQASNNVSSTGVWYFIVCWHDSVADTINIQLNAFAPDSISYSFGVFDPSGITFRLGAFSNTATGFWDGRIDQAGFWKRVLDSSERAQLYNAGNGLSYAALVGGAEFLYPKIVMYY